MAAQDVQTVGIVLTLVYRKCANHVLALCIQLATKNEVILLYYQIWHAGKGNKQTTHDCRKRKKTTYG